MRYHQVCKACIAALALLSLPAGTKPRQAAPPSDLHAEIQQTYNFQPHTLTTAQINQKSAVLDQFWAKAKSQRDTYVPGLRRELADFSNPPFFLYDGASLLSTLAKDPGDDNLILAAIAHSDVRDLQAKDYFYRVHSMAVLGEDTTAAAFNILSSPSFTVFVPQHALTLGQNYCLVYMLLPTDQKFWAQPAIARMQSEKDETAQKSLLLLLWYAQTSESDKAIADFANDANKPQASKAYANEMMHRKDSVGTMSRLTALPSSEESLRQTRRERMKAVSDEALLDLDSYTAKIIAKRK